MRVEDAVLWIVLLFIGATLLTLVITVVMAVVAAVIESIGRWLLERGGGANDR